MKQIFFVGIIFVFILLLAKTFQDQLHFLGGRLGSYFSALKPANLSSHELEMNHLMAENTLLKSIIHELREEAHYPKKEGQLLVGARVIFREPASWGCYMWIDRGHKNAEGIVSLFSPVILGEDLLGMIDFVGDTMSRVCLITNSKLSTAVELKGNFIQSMRGEICGGGYPLWRRELTILQGVLFNQPGLIYEKKEGDTLVTSGLDGVFPRGLRVGIVTEMDVMKEGAISTKLKAKSLVLESSDLSYVQVLAAINRAPKSQIGMGINVY